MKMLKSEIEFVKFNTMDVIMTSGGQIPLNSDPETTPDENSPAEDKKYGGWGFNDTTKLI